MAWVDITNGQVAAGAAVNTALMTALRDNVEALGADDVNAPPVFGALKSAQAFTASGTWTKPDKVRRVIVVVTGGGSNGSTVGGGNAAGTSIAVLDVDGISSSTITVGGIGGLSRWADGTNTVEGEGGGGAGASSGGEVNIPRAVAKTGSNCDGVDSFWGGAGSSDPGNASAIGSAAVGYGSGGGGAGGSGSGGAGKAGIVWVLEF